MRDITLEDTFTFEFTTRALTGIPTVLANTPVLSVKEGDNATPITAGVSVTVDAASVVGLNEGKVVGTAGNNILWRDYFGASAARGTRIGMVFRKGIPVPIGVGCKIVTAAGGASVVIVANMAGYER